MSSFCICASLLYDILGLLPPSPSQQGLSLPPPSSQTEVWFEHRTADGRTYYSHPQTQKTTWERPQNAQIIPQPSPGNVFPTCISWVCIIWNESSLCQLQKVHVCYYQLHLGMKWPILPDRTGKEGIIWIIFLFFFRRGSSARWSPTSLPLPPPQHARCTPISAYQGLV